MIRWLSFFLLTVIGLSEIVLNLKIYENRKPTYIQLKRGDLKKK